MSLLHYRIVDVFTTEPLEGNALAVFTNGSEIDSGIMQKIAREMNLAETVFILPPEDPSCLARLRIFTPQKEMIFAGHPTIGSSFVLFDAERVLKLSESFFLEEKIGNIQIWVEHDEGPMIWMRTPRIREGRVFDRTLCAQTLNVEPGDLLDVEPKLLDAGNPTLFVALRNKEAVDRALLDPQGMMSLRNDDPEPFCVFVFTPTEGGAYSRMFAPDYGVPEDPATGSSTGPLAAFMMKHDLLSGVLKTRFISEQGTKMLRRSRLHVRIGDDPDDIYVGGHVTPIAEGTMKL